jgi:hypothetical protein
LVTKLPKALLRRSRRIAIDLTLIPYHGQPHLDKKEIYRSAPKSGTTHFHAYATAAVVHKGHRYTLALIHVEHGEKMKPVVQNLLKIIRSRGVKVRFLLLDKAFFSVEMISYLKRAGYGYTIPAMVRGRKPKGREQATGLRAIQKKNNCYQLACDESVTAVTLGLRRAVGVPCLPLFRFAMCPRGCRRPTRTPSAVRLNDVRVAG